MLIYIFLIVLLLVIITCAPKENENYMNFCEVSNYNRRFKPINMIISDIQPFRIDKDRTTVNPVNPVTLDVLEKIINDIPIQKLNVKMTEMSGVKYNFIDPPQYETIPEKDINYLINMLKKKLKYRLKKELLKSNSKSFDKDNPPLVHDKDVRILLIGKNKNKIAIEGQVLFQLRNIDFLINFVISNINKFSIHNLVLSGFEFTKHKINGYEKAMNLEIYREPIINKYNADKTYLMSSSESKFNTDYIAKNRDKIELSPYRCYGKIAYNNFDCESKYDINGKKNYKIGVWDKLCSNNSECPFYKKNLNYPNTFGKCMNGYCQMPLGIESISPRKFNIEKQPLCGNCKKGINCCSEQKDLSKYPDLKSPDYRFANDNALRKKYNMN